MRTSFFLIIVACFISACTQNSGTRDNDRSEKRIRKQAISIAETYATTNLSDAKKTKEKNGTITIGNDQKLYVIDPKKIFIGFIDKDSLQDAIISLFPYEDQYEVTTEHLIILQTDGKFKLIRSLESDMRIISLKDGIITAEVPEHSRNTPLFNCPSCWEVVKFRFINGELVRTE